MKLPQFSKAFQRRFWDAPLDAVPYFQGSKDCGFIASGQESAVLLKDDVPDSVNGFRLAKVGTISNNAVGGGYQVRVYISERNTQAPTTLQFNLMTGFKGFVFDVAFLIPPATHWEATIKNLGLSQYSHGGLTFAGWYF